MEKISDIMKAVKEETPKTFAVFVLDETGSMSERKGATISGFNEYIETLKRQKDERLFFSLTLFNSDKIEHLYQTESLNNVRPLDGETYKPMNLTPLYDAIGQAINELKGRLAKETEKHRVLFIVMTDGYENHSKEFTREQVFELIKKQEKKGWTFVYLGANQDAWQEGGKMGFAPQHTSDYNPDEMVQSFAMASSMTNQYCKTGKVDLTEDSGTSKKWQSKKD